MPMLEIEVVGAMPRRVRDGLARRLADAAGDALGSRPSSTWVRLRILEAEDYAENGSDRAGSDAPHGELPVFVSVLARSLPEGDLLAEQVEALTQAIANVCERPAARVHVRYEPEGRGRQAFGGRLVE